MSWLVGSKALATEEMQLSLKTGLCYDHDHGYFRALPILIVLFAVGSLRCAADIGVPDAGDGSETSIILLDTSDGGTDASGGVHYDDFTITNP